MRGLMQDWPMRVHRFIDHAAPKRQYEWAGLDAPHIVATALAALGQQAERARG